MIQFPVKQTFSDRYVARLTKGFPRALEQLQKGGSVTPWMWKLFPVLRCLAKSHTAEVFGMPDLRWAKAYLAHPVLGKQLTALCEAILARPDKRSETFISPLCGENLQASMTLFAMASGENSLYHRMLEALFDGAMDPRTVARLTRQQAMVIREGVLLDCFGYPGDLVIPEGVTAIAPRVFYKRDDLHSVTLPEGLTCIGRAAFYDCRNLAAVHMPQTVKEIGEYAFFYCTALKAIKLPEGLTELGTRAFHNCDSLTHMDIPVHLREGAAKAFHGLHLLNHE